MAHGSFSDDLVRLQADWYRTYTALAVSRPASGAELRRRLQTLSVRLLWHPYWSGPGRMPAARAELRRQVRAMERQLC
ncbi:hypothetical protein [Streptomyces cadmiisoli]|uniref:hypothetical protein n=1 Tax=Streptomyces cadmiisoli TaxID=2184053 RepID=UPI00364FC4C4